ncbi:MAG: hypothetical protein ACRDZN_14040, partial [Acidimicrobiales bacterium]
MYAILVAAAVAALLVLLVVKSVHRIGPAQVGLVAKKVGFNKLPGDKKGVQRPVLPPGTLMPIHPVAFLVITSREVFGLPVAPELAALVDGGQLTPRSFGLAPEQLRVVVIAPQGST